eukprot:CAMPEP_0182895514 /NCGR_PEP_ID=MMETSP0034_2-20130328/25730_1 /TAXON_ID=156128 /ORGANISM="Nephroselmis pyriformis, Strain CCMP717" /LENGTH=56 /DNA_ID=CAMNT_0025029349 /DNA_START=144 /DNA_END=314 /DNA_ORIENTATION=-
MKEQKEQSTLPFLKIESNQVGQCNEGDADQPKYTKIQEPRNAQLTSDMNKPDDLLV